MHAVQRSRVGADARRRTGHASKRGEAVWEKAASKRRQAKGGKQKAASKRRQAKGGKQKAASKRRQAKGGKQKAASAVNRRESIQCEAARKKQITTEQER
ncbi:hypothetical protein WN982_31390 [Paraburkholderia sp. IMGN_8]|uniref:hypothetical protein n=1 Tax=Paraburkholderia sp. IMGN_8 TaxID=3136564 RepID=UPI003100DDFA